MFEIIETEKMIYVILEVTLHKPIKQCIDNVLMNFLFLQYCSGGELFDYKERHTCIFTHYLFYKLLYSSHNTLG